MLMIFNMFCVRSVTVLARLWSVDYWQSELSLCTYDM